MADDYRRCGGSSRQQAAGGVASSSHGETTAYALCVVGSQFMKPAIWLDNMLGCG